MTDDTPVPAPITDTPPDRLSATHGSPYFDEAALTRGVGIRFNGVERTTVEEYCVSEGWVRLTIGKTRDRKGNPITLKQQGVVEPWYKS